MLRNLMIGQSRRMSSLRDIRDRIKSVSNIQKLTKSMKMVAGAKYTRADREYQLFKEYGQYSEDLFSRFSFSTEPKSRLIIGLSSDRGLCGSCHTSIIKSIQKSTESKQKIENYYALIGERIFTIHKIYKNVVCLAHSVGKTTATLADASEIIKEIMPTIEKVDYIEIHSNKPQSGMSFSTHILTIPTLKSIKLDKNIDTYDEVEDQILESFFFSNLQTIIYFELRQSNTAEIMIRMTSMENSTKNASQMISDLKLKFNRTRQSLITRELIEIISGATTLREQ